MGAFPPQDVGIISRFLCCSDRFAARWGAASFTSRGRPTPLGGGDAELLPSRSGPPKARLPLVAITGLPRSALAVAGSVGPRCYRNRTMFGLRLYERAGREHPHGLGHRRPA